MPCDGNPSMHIQLFAGIFAPFDLPKSVCSVDTVAENCP